MRSINDSVETVNAAATAIVSAESRVQPSSVQKRRWGSFWRLYWCFGTFGSQNQKNGKRIGHAVLVPEPVITGGSVPASQNVANSTGVVVPFIAPPSSPASFLPSDPPSATQSPAGLSLLTNLSVNSYSPRGPASIFAIGPYAHETQLVTPPVFSAFTTEPSTAPYTPPPESVQLTTPSSPEVPFAQLLTSSLERARRNSGTNQKFGLSYYDFQSYQIYPGSPGGNLISPGSVISNSGTSTPFPDKRHILEIRMGEASKIFGFEHFTTHKWGSRLGSGSLTPDGLGQGSRLGSGALTPDGLGQGSRLGSGALTPDGLGQDSRLASGALTPDGLGQGSRLGSGAMTPDGMGLGSRLGSGCLTPDGIDPASRDSFPLDHQISNIAALAGSDNIPKGDDIVLDHHRVSFELSGEEVARCLENKLIIPVRTISECPKNTATNDGSERHGIPTDHDNCEFCLKGTSDETSKKASEEGEDAHHQKHRSISLGSIKEFHFDSTKGEASDKTTIRSEWWANEKVAGKDTQPSSNWTFFPILQPEVN